MADALSRNAEEELLEAISGPSWAIWEDIRTNLEGDPRCKENMEKRAVEQDGVNNFEMKDGLLLCKGRVVVPNKGELRKRVIEHFHDSKEGGHSGNFRAGMRIANTFYWDGMKNDVRDYVRACEVCRRIKGDSRKPSGLMHPLPIPELVWEDITMDFVEGLPTSKGLRRRPTYF